MPDSDSSGLIAELHTRRAEIEVALASLAEWIQPVELDQTVQGRLSRMDAITQQQMAQASRTHLQLELSRIAAALVRFERGTYGVCCRCDLPMEPARLRADPSVPLCIDCLAELAEERAREDHRR